MREAGHSEFEKMNLAQLFAGSSLKVATAEGTYYVIPMASGDDEDLSINAVVEDAAHLSDAARGI